MGYKFDIIKRPEPWTVIVDYAVYSRANTLMILPRIMGFHHLEASSIFDHRADRDFRDNINRAEPYMITWARRRR